MGAGGDDSAAMQTRDPRAAPLGDVVENGEVSGAEPRERLLSEEDIYAGLQNLGPIASGLRQAYLRLDVSSLQLTSLAGIERYSHLQTLIARGNDLDDVCCLGSLRSLTHLDLSKNRLTTLLEGMSPPPHNLRYLDVSGNSITNVESLSSFRHLEEVHLGDNLIETVEADTMHALPILKTLTLGRNKLRSLHGVRAASSLKHLDVSENDLSKINELRGLTALTYLDISGNGLLTLGSMEDLPLLGTLLMDNNYISSLNGLLPLQKLTYLRRLTVKGNTLTHAHKARLHILYLLPSLTLLDGDEVRIEDKVEAANLHGADIEGLRSIRAKFFPNRGDEALLLAPDEHSLSTAAAAGSLPSAEGSGAVLGDDKKDRWNQSGGAGGGGWGGLPNANDDRGLSFDIPLDDLIDTSEFGAYVLKNTSGQREAARACFDWVVANAAAPGAQYHTIADAAVREDAALLRPERCSAEVEAMLCCGPGEDELCAPGNGACANPGSDAERHGAVEAVDGDSGAARSAAPVDIVDEHSGVVEPEAMTRMPSSGPWSRRMSALYARLVASCGLECAVVRGVARFPGMPVGRIITRSNHHWNVVTIDSRRCIVDSAWAAAGIDPDGFCIPPDEFVYQRFPEDPSDQLLDASISLQQFWSLPLLLPAFFAFNLRLQSHATSIVSVEAGNSEVNISVAAPPGVTLHHVCREAGKTTSASVSAGADTASTPATPYRTVNSSGPDSCGDTSIVAETDKDEDEDEDATTSLSTPQSQQVSGGGGGGDIGGSRTLAQRDLDGNYVLRTALSGFSASYINIFACPEALSRPRLVLCYRIFREALRIFDDSGRGSLHTLPVKVHSTDMDSTTSFCYPVVSHEFTRRGCTIIDPIVGRLVQGSVETFRVRVPRATTVSVAANDGTRNTLSRQYLRRADDASDTFVGQVCVPSSSCIVLATFGGEETRESAEEYDATGATSIGGAGGAGGGHDDVPVLLHSYEVIQSKFSVPTDRPLDPSEHASPSGESMDSPAFDVASI